MRKCTNCGRWRRCNTMDKRRNTPCSDWRRARRIRKVAKYMMVTGILVMIDVVAICGHFRAGVSWGNVAALCIGMGMALIGDLIWQI